MNLRNRRRILGGFVIVAVVWPAVGRTARCTSDEWVQHIRTVVLPSWSSITPEDLASTWPGGLKQTGSGSSVTWSHVGTDCAVYFVFAPRDTGPPLLRLVRLRLMSIGARAELFRHAQVMASAVGPELTQDELRALNQQEEVRSVWRLPADQSVSGVIRTRTLTLTARREPHGRQKSSWQLEMLYDDFPDAAVKTDEGGAWRAPAGGVTRHVWTPPSRQKSNARRQVIVVPSMLSLACQSSYEAALMIGEDDRSTALMSSASWWGALRAPGHDEYTPRAWANRPVGLTGSSDVCGLVRVGRTCRAIKPFA